MADTSAAGRQAEKPSQFGWKAWRDVGRRTKGEIKSDRLSMVAAGVAFYAFMAVFPAIAAVVSIYGIVADPADIQQVVEGVRGVLPPQVVDVVSEQMTAIASTSGTALGIGAIIAILVAVWSATKGMKALMDALNVAYEEEESRGFIRLNLVALALTLGGMIALILAVALVVALPALLGRVGLPETIATVLAWARWPVLALALMAGLAMLYRYAPSRASARWQWVSIGAVAATVLWLIASALFSLYVSKSDSYNETYGSLAAIVILLMWLYISAYVILMGAEMNSEMEHQTVKDTTTGEPRPLGARQARVADTVAGEPETGVAPRGRRTPAPGPAHPAAPKGRGRRPAPEVTVLKQSVDQARAALGHTLDELGARLTPRGAADAVIGKVQEARDVTEQPSPGRGRYDYLRHERPLLMGALGIAVGAALAHAQEKQPHAPSR